MVKYKVLSTKELKSSVLQYIGNVEVLQKDFISIQSLAYTLPENLKAEKISTVFTSKNAVMNLNGFTPVKVYCLSGATRAAVQERFPTAELMRLASNASDLANMIIADCEKEVLFFCGDKRRDVLPKKLASARIKVHEVVVYQSVETPIQVEEKFDAVIFFSPSAVSSFFSVNQLQPEAICFAIGDTTAEAIATYCENKTVSTDSPSEEELLQKVIYHFEKMNLDHSQFTK
jgi:uroporphyrinogen-III synthase